MQFTFSIGSQFDNYEYVSLLLCNSLGTKLSLLMLQNFRYVHVHIDHFMHTLILFQPVKQTGENIQMKQWDSHLLHRFKVKNTLYNYFSSSWLWLEGRRQGCNRGSFRAPIILVDATCRTNYHMFCLVWFLFYGPSKHISSFRTGSNTQTSNHTVPEQASWAVYQY